MPPAEPARARFDRKLTPEPNTGCWLWTGGINHDGYGEFWGPGGRKVKSHRFAWVMANGPITDGLSVLHRCDQPACCAIEHLFLGTQRDNLADMHAKGRGVPKKPQPPRTGPCRGERHPRAVLTAASVLEIRRGRAAGVRAADLADVFGVDRCTVEDIVARRSWAHLPAVESVSIP